MSRSLAASPPLTVCVLPHVLLGFRHPNVTLVVQNTIQSKGSTFYLFGLGAHDPMSPQRLQSHALMNPVHRYQLKICPEHSSANQTTSMCARNSSALRGFVGNRVRRSVGRREHRNLAVVCVRLPPPHNTVLMSYFKGNATPKKVQMGKALAVRHFHGAPSEQVPDI